ncbi:uncharacterized protein N7503_008085 [Penicillium pulvis]|uniref:uncharacterized protein n=1 Tax=Penicillium pulvis TaxID=1562058 RepID=UPI0025474422|nr:uncharacterized protein N7503_008085 [Penicillium pulvis]KAJ5792107.1 hypothetical protein N7503_008085 [Penicillium pulvis]
MTQPNHTTTWEKNKEIDFNAQEPFAPQSLSDIRSHRAPNRSSRFYEHSRAPSFFDRKKKRTRTEKALEKIRVQNKSIAKKMKLPLTFTQLYTRLRLLSRWYDGDICPENLQDVYYRELRCHREQMKFVRLDRKIERALANVHVTEPRGKIEEMQITLGCLTIISEDETMD